MQHIATATIALLLIYETCFADVFVVIVDLFDCFYLYINHFFKIIEIYFGFTAFLSFFLVFFKYIL